jgi:hypothetical protein
LGQYWGLFCAWVPSPESWSPRGLVASGGCRGHVWTWVDTAKVGNGED